MRLKMLPKKGDLRNLNNWRGIMLLDAASKIIPMVISGRLQRLLKEVGIEEQNGFMGGRGGSDGVFCQTNSEAMRTTARTRKTSRCTAMALFETARTNVEVGGAQGGRPAAP